LHAGLEALSAAVVLVESGDADNVVVVAVDDAGPVTRALYGDGIVSGAVAFLVSATPRDAIARVGRIELTRGRPAAGPVAAGHRALVPLALGATAPGELACASPPDAYALVGLEPV
jgi:3-oxoacyl-[acyl-carrier-protein] synthase-1/3-oxoacyl-[acyl-carrier-protein] synthase II